MAAFSEESDGRSPESAEPVAGNDARGKAEQQRQQKTRSDAAHRRVRRYRRGGLLKRSGSTCIF